MSKLFNWAAARIVAAFALALPLAAMAAPNATAVWRSNLGQSYTIGGNTYAVTPRDGTLNQDGTITVSSTWGDKAPYIDLEGANVGIVSVLVKYSGLDISQIYDADGDSIGVAFASIIDSDNNVVGSCVQKVNGVANNTVRAYHCGASATSATPKDIGNMTAVEGAGYLLFAFKDSQGSRSYMGTSIDNLTGGEDTAGHWSGRNLKKLVLGGDESGKAFNGAGFKIEEVAIFVGSYLTASDVADYVFPTVTADAAVTTMSALNAKVASLDNEFLYFSNAAVVTLDEEPSEATKAFLQGANWNGTVFIKDQNIVNLNPAIYGNPNSTLKLSGVSGHWGAAVYEKTATPAIELEDSETEGREYGYYASNGYSFYSQGAYYYVHTPELKGSGTYKANTTGNGALFVADKFDNFTGKLNLEGKTVWLGTGAPTKSVDTWNNMVNFPGTVRLGSTIPANYATWNVPNGYKGTVVLTAAASEQYQVNFLTSSTWKGTCQLNWNATGKLDIVNYGNANSVIEIPSTFSALPTQNGGSDGAEVASEVKIIGSWTVSDGWTGESYRTTFAKLSGSGTLTVNGGSGGVGDPLPYTITRLEGFTGTIAGTRGKFTIGTIVAATEPTPGTKLVNFTTANAPVLDSTKVVYTNVEQDVELEFKAGDGIYVALPPSVTITVPAVANTTVSVVASEGDVVDNGDGTYTVAADSVVTVTYAAADGYQISGQTVYTIDTSKSETTFELDESTKVDQFVARVRNYGTSLNDQYTTLAAAVAAADGVTHANAVVLVANVTEEEVTVSSAIMISGSYAINDDIKIAEGGQLQLMQSTLNGKLTIEEGGSYKTMGGTIGELVAKDGAAIELTTLSDVVAPLTVTTLSLEGELTVISSWGSAVRDTYYKAISYVTANADIAESATVDSVNEWSAKVEEEGDNTVVYLAITKVAVVDGVYYDDAQDAVDAAVSSGKPVSFLVEPGTVKLGAGETLVVSGATLPTVVLDDGLAAPYEVEHTIDAVNIINIYTVKRFIAKLKNPNINSTTYQAEVKYTSLAAALADVVEHTQAVYAAYPAIVTLLADDDVSFADVEVVDGVPSGGSVVIDKNVVINGAGYTVYGNTNAEILNATSYVEPGTEDKDMLADLADGSNLLGFFVKRGNVTFTNITLTEFGDTAYLNKFGYTPIQTASAYTGTLTLNGVNFSKFNRTAVCVRGGTLSMTGGNISGGTVNKEGDSGNVRYFQQPIEVRGGTATISGVTITGGNDIAGNGGGAIVAWSATTVTNVIVNFTGVGIWADYPVITVTGDSTSVTATDKALFVEDGGTINVSAGTFTGALAIDAVPGSSISITGGTFSVDPSDYVASGYAANKSGDVWVVSEYVPPSGIDPESGTEITVDTTKTPEEQAADAQAAAAAMDVKKTADASSVDQTTWNGYFTKTAEKVNDTWVAKAELNPAVVLPVDGAEETPLTDMLESVTAAAVDTTGNTHAEIPTKAGLYYWISGATEVNAASYTPGTAVLGDGEKKELVRPTLTGENGKAFFKVCVDVVAPTKE